MTLMTAAYTGCGQYKQWLAYPRNAFHTQNDLHMYETLQIYIVLHVQGKHNTAAAGSKWPLQSSTLLDSLWHVSTT